MSGRSFSGPGRAKHFFQKISLRFLKILKLFQNFQQITDIIITALSVLACPDCSVWQSNFITNMSFLVSSEKGTNGTEAVEASCQNEGILCSDDWLCDSKEARIPGQPLGQ